MIKQYLAILFLLAGVVAGLVLVTRSQEFREKAREGYKATYTVCHKSDPSGDLWEEIEVVGDDILEYYLSIGDKLGSCDNRAETDFLVSTSGNVWSQENLPAGEGVVNFKISYQSVSSKRPDQSVKIVLISESGSPLVFDNVPVRSDENGIYFGSLNNIKPGVYDVSVKGKSHLQVKFDNFSVSTDGSTVDWSYKPLIAGDFNSDNLIDLSDIAKLLSFYEKKESEVSSENALYDINFDGIINFLDVDTVTANYNSLEVNGEE